MKFLDFFKMKNEKEKDLPWIARVDLKKLQEEREKEMQDREVSILAAHDYTNPIYIRLFYVALEKFKRYGTNKTMLGETSAVSSPFKIPSGMTLEEACNVISYISEQVEKKYNLSPACEKSVQITSQLLPKYLFDEQYGYTTGHFHAVSRFCRAALNDVGSHVNANECFIRGKNVKEIYSIGGDLELFEKSNLNYNYVEWFNEGVSREEIMQIYNRLGYRLKDIEGQMDEPSK